MKLQTKNSLAREWVWQLGAFLSLGLIVAGVSLYALSQREQTPTPPAFMYMGPDVPPKIAERIAYSMDNYDEKIIKTWYKDTVYDGEFQMALFYSYLALALAEKVTEAGGTQAEKDKRDRVFKDSVELWRSVLKKDSELIIFRNYFVDKYAKTVRNEDKSGQKVIK